MLKKKVRYSENELIRWKRAAKEKINNEELSKELDRLSNLEETI